MKLLLRKGASVQYVDPYVPELVLDDVKLVSLPLTRSTLEAHDCAVVVAAHRTFDYALIAEAAPLVVDVRNAVRSRCGIRQNVVAL
jgi:UDP-N-acetyl-D-glucosamine dehydrogenase